MSELEPERVRSLLRGGLGDPYAYFDETTSTQDVLRAGELSHGAVAVTEHQTDGRGRSERTWEDVASRSLLFSVALRAPSDARLLPQLSLVAGLAVATALECELRTPVVVKWPNDVLVGGSKVAGILLEASAGMVVCGIGINVNQGEGELPSATRTPATSLRLVAGRSLDRGVLLAAVLGELEARYADWIAGGLGALTGELERRNALRDRRVRVDGLAGMAGAIAPGGGLTVVLDSGEVMLVESGEVELVAGETLASG